MAHDQEENSRVFLLQRCKYYYNARRYYIRFKLQAFKFKKLKIHASCYISQQPTDLTNTIYINVSKRTWFYLFIYWYFQPFHDLGWQISFFIFLFLKVFKICISINLIEQYASCFLVAVFSKLPLPRIHFFQANSLFHNSLITTFLFMWT